MSETLVLVEGRGTGGLALKRVQRGPAGHAGQTGAVPTFANDCLLETGFRSALGVTKRSYTYISDKGFTLRV